MLTKPLGEDVSVMVTIHPSKSLRADLNTELMIDTSDIMGEIINQPSKYAYWAVMADLSGTKVSRLQDKLSLTNIGDSCYFTLLKEYNQAVEHHELLSKVQQAFNHRKTALLQLWGKTPKRRVLKEYHENLSYLRAILKANVPLNAQKTGGI